MDDLTFTALNDDGEEIACEILFSFASEDNGREYVVYTDHSVDEEGNTRVFASYYIPDDEEQILYPIDSDEEWAFIESVMDELESGFEAMPADATDDELTAVMDDVFADFGILPDDEE